MAKFPNFSFTSKKEVNDFDSILPLTSKSSKGKQSSLLGYIYDKSASIGSLLTGSCQNSLVYVSGLAGSIAKYGTSKSSLLPKTQQDAVTKVFNPFNGPDTPTTTPIMGENEGKWLIKPSNSQNQINNYEIKIKTPSPSIFH